MYDAAAAWLMTLLAPSPLLVSLVQAATTLPLFLLALPAGALADIFDRRRILLIAQVWWFLTTALLGVLTITGVIQPWMLLVITLAIGTGSAIDLPAWQAIIPETVPREELPAAVGLGSIAINIARAIGPALAGVIIVAGGPGPVFLINAVSVLGVFVVLWRWRRQPTPVVLPAERLLSAMRAGVRYVRHAPALRNVIVRTPAFVAFASALWALLPVVVRTSLGRGAVSYGVLVGSLGLGGRDGVLRTRMWRARMGQQFRDPGRSDGHRRDRLAHDRVEPAARGPTRRGRLGAWPGARDIDPDAVRLARPRGRGVGRPRESRGRCVGTHSCGRRHVAGTGSHPALPPDRGRGSRSRAVAQLAGSGRRGRVGRRSRAGSRHGRVHDRSRSASRFCRRRAQTPSTDAPARRRGVLGAVRRLRQSQALCGMLAGGVVGGALAPA